MSVKLRTSDRRAIDLLMDRAAVVAPNGKPVVTYAEPALRERVFRVEQLLEALDALETPEPPADLVERTLRLVEGSSSVANVADRLHPALHDPTAPMA